MSTSFLAGFSLNRHRLTERRLAAWNSGTERLVRHGKVRGLRKSSPFPIHLGLNIDHVATVREARGGAEPSVLRAALEGIRGGAGSITAHLREDRRHIQDRDVFELKKKISVPLNLEMSIAEDIVRVALRLRPAKACLVPERREELTTEGGLDVAGGKRRIAQVVRRLQAKGILVSLFIDPIRKQIQAACDVNADFVELHTGRYANAVAEQRRADRAVPSERAPDRRLHFRRRTSSSSRKVLRTWVRVTKRCVRELDRLRESARHAASLGLGVNAGHGLNLENVSAVARIHEIRELNIGHSIVAHAVSCGLFRAVREMKKRMRKARVR